MSTSAPTLPTRARPRARGALAVLYAMLLATPLGVMLLLGPSHVDDNNPPARWPTLADPWSLIPHRFEIAFDRTFGGRPSLVAAYHRLFVLTLGAPSMAAGVDRGAPIRHVLVGTGGELFYSRDGIEPHRAATPWPPAVRDAWRAELRRRAAWFATHGVRYLVVIAPDKQSLYDEALPSWARRVGSPWLDVLYRDLAQDGVAAVDARPALGTGRRTARTYWRTDSHWNAFGACLAAAEVVAQLQRPVPPCAPVSTANNGGGDLAALLGLRHALVDEAASPPHAPTDAPTGHLLLAGDSFAAALSGALARSFASVSQLNTEGLDGAAALALRPDVVVDEIVERKLAMPPPRARLSAP